MPAEQNNSADPSGGEIKHRLLSRLSSGNYTHISLHNELALNIIFQCELNMSCNSNRHCVLIMGMLKSYSMDVFSQIEQRH